jgi:hypothetical protein
MKRTLLLLLLPLCVFPFRMQAQNKIDKSKSELNAPKEKSSSSSRSSSGSSSDDDDDDDNGWLIEATIDGFVYTFGAVWIGLVGDYENEEHFENELTEYPYYLPETGNYFNTEFGEGNKNNFRIDLKDKFVYASNHLYGNHLTANVHPFQYFYAKVDYYQIYEFQKAAGTSDNLSLFYFNFAYDRFHLERFNIGWTLGASYIGSGVDKGGFSYGLNAEYFLIKNISFQANAKWSHINSRPVNTYEAEARFHKKNYFLTMGYEHLKIATPTYNFITLGAGIYF